MRPFFVSTSSMMTTLARKGGRKWKNHFRLMTKTSLAKQRGGRPAVCMGFSYFPALSALCRSSHKPFPDYLWRDTSSDRADTAISQAQTEVKSASTLDSSTHSYLSAISQAQTEVGTASMLDSPTHSYSFKHGWPRRHFTSSASSFSSVADEAYDRYRDESYNSRIKEWVFCNHRSKSC